MLKLRERADTLTGDTDFDTGITWSVHEGLIDTEAFEKEHGVEVVKNTCRRGVTLMGWIRNDMDLDAIYALSKQIGGARAPN